MTEWIRGDGVELSRTEYAGLYAAVAQAFRAGEMDPFQVYSASLPLRVRVIAGRELLHIYLDVRPWNGRVLTPAEQTGAYRAAHEEHEATGSWGLAAQAAHEWLSEHAP